MWLYQGKEFTSEQIQDYKGFVYELTDTVNGMKYIGQKRFWKKTATQRKETQKT